MSILTSLALKCQFSFKMGETSFLKLNNFLPIKNGKFGNPAFFSSAQAIQCVNFW